MLRRNGECCSSPRAEQHNRTLPAFLRPSSSGFTLPGTQLFVFGSVLTLLFTGGLAWKSFSTPAQAQAQKLTAQTENFTDSLDRVFTVNIPSAFKELVTLAALSVEGETIFGGPVTFSGGSVFDGQITLQGDVLANGVSIDLGSGQLTASNVLYSLVQGDGITISEGQTPTITNSDRGSAQSIFKKIKYGSDTIEADSNDDTLEFAAGSGISLSLDTSNDKLTVTNSAVPGFVKSGTYAVFASGVTKVGIGTDTPGNTVEISSGTSGASGLTFTNLTSASSVGAGGGKVLSVDSGGNVILVTDESGGVSSGDLDSALPGGSTGSTIYFDGSTWAHSTNLYHNGGQVGISAIPGTNIRFDVKTNATTSVGMVIRRVSSQTANLMEFRNESDSILSYIDANGVFNGSANTSGSLNPGFTTGSVAFQGASGLTQDNANFYWDDTNNRLGIGTASPTSILEINGGTTSTNVKITSTANNATIGITGNNSFKGYLGSISGVLGIYDPSANGLSVISGGNVGIGTTSPNAKLEVYSSAAANAAGQEVLRLAGTHDSATVGSGSRLVFTHTTGVEAAAIQSYQFGSADTGLAFKTGWNANTTKMVINNAGNVGIGTSSPNEKLTLYNANDSQLQFVNSTTGSTSSDGTIIGHDTGENVFTFSNQEAGSAAFRWFGNGSELVRLLTSGSLGIGTTSPYSKLDLQDGILSLTTSSGTASQTKEIYFRPKNDGGSVGSKIQSIANLSPTSSSAYTSGFKFITADWTGSAFVEREALILAASGSVGIGVSPLSSHRLSVDGKIGGKTYSGSYLYFPESGVSNAGTTELASNNGLRFIEAGVVRAVIDDDGRFGIGTTTPTSLLHVEGPTGSALARFNQTGSGDILTASSSGTTRLVVTNTGDVGIGTSSPTSSLDVLSGSGVSPFRFTNNAGAYFTLDSSQTLTYYAAGSSRMTFNATMMIINTTQGISAAKIGNQQSTGGLEIVTINNASNTKGIDLYAYYQPIRFFADNGAATERMRIDSSGNVGIGTTTPTSKLHVEGYYGGNALARFNLTGTGDILTASASGVTKLTINSTGQFVPDSETRSLTASGNISADKIWPRNHNLQLTLNGRQVSNTTFADPHTLLRGSFLPTTTGTNKYVGTGVYVDINQTGGHTGDYTAFQVDAVETAATGTNKLLADFKTGGTSMVSITSSGRLTFESDTGTQLYRIADDNLRATGTLSVATQLLTPLLKNLSGGVVIAQESAGNVYLGSTSAGGTQATNLILNPSGNVGIGTSTFGTNAVKVLALAGSTAPTTAITDGIQLFAVDQAGSHELRVMDEAGNTTTLSPHNFSVIGDKSEEMAWSFYSERNALAINADMAKAMRLVERLSGEKIVYLKDLDTGEYLEDESDATKVTELAANGLISGIAKWNYDLWTFVGNVIFEKPVKFLADATFRGKLLLNPNQTGTAIIPAGAKGIKVTFSQPLPSAPIVNLTPQGELTGRLVLNSVSPESFTIELTQAQDSELTIHWLASLRDQSNSDTPTIEVLGAETAPAAVPTPSTPSSSTPIPSPSPSLAPEASSSASPVATDSAQTQEGTE